MKKLKKLLPLMLLSPALANAAHPTNVEDYGTCEKYGYMIDYDASMKHQYFKIFDIKTGQVLTNKRMVINGQIMVGSRPYDNWQNTLAFNNDDNLLYSFERYGGLVINKYSKSYNTPAGVDGLGFAHEVEVIPIGVMAGTTVPSINFMAGFIHNNEYYMWTYGSGGGLYSIGLTSDKPNYLKLQKIKDLYTGSPGVDLDKTSLPFMYSDFIVHPSDGKIYTFINTEADALVSYNMDTEETTVIEVDDSEVSLEEYDYFYHYLSLFITGLYG